MGYALAGDSAGMAGKRYDYSVFFMGMVGWEFKGLRWGRGWDRSGAWIYEVRARRF